MHLWIEKLQITIENYTTHYLCGHKVSVAGYFVYFAFVQSSFVVQ